MKQNILFVLAHYDDESFSAGTIKKLKDLGHNIYILIVCGNGNSLDDNRKLIFLEQCKILDIPSFHLKFFDLTLIDLDEALKNNIKRNVLEVIDDYKIDIVYTNYSGDLHSDHKEVSNMVRVVCRPSVTHIKKLYECYIPGAMENGQYKLFNTIVNITENINFKSQWILNYKASLTSMDYHKISMTQSQYIGSLNQFKYAEMFELIWSKE